VCVCVCVCVFCVCVWFVCVCVAQGLEAMHAGNAEEENQDAMTTAATACIDSILQVLHKSPTNSKGALRTAKSPLMNPTRIKRALLTSPTIGKGALLESPTDSKRALLQVPNRSEGTLLKDTTDRKTALPKSATTSKRALLRSPTNSKRALIMSPTKSKRALLKSLNTLELQREGELALSALLALHSQGVEVAGGEQAEHGAMVREACYHALGAAGAQVIKLRSAATASLAEVWLHSNGGNGSTGRSGRNCCNEGDSAPEQRWRRVLWNRACLVEEGVVLVAG
jgi:uncharacterized ferritin-like protein (DUF455 family)